MTLPTDAELVNLAAAIYHDGGQWDYFDPGFDDEICVAIKKLDGCDVVVFRGSIVFHDWVVDFRADPIKTTVGTVHSGFHADMPKAWAELKPKLTQPVIVTGHSLGAARADILCGLMALDGVLPARRVVFGEPRPGMADFAKLIAEIPAVSYRNIGLVRHDYVTDVPLKLLPPFNFVHPTELTSVPVKLTANFIDKCSLFAYHHIELYQTSVARSNSSE